MAKKETIESLEDRIRELTLDSWQAELDVSLLDWRIAEMQNDLDTTQNDRDNWSV